MNAKEAREKTEQNIKIAIDGQYSNIKGEIEEAVSLKQFQANHYGNIRPEVKRILESEGFRVVSQAGRPGDEPDTVIHW